MPHREFSMEEVAEYLHLSREDVERLMREAEMPHQQRGQRIVFQRGEVDAWASRRILGLSGKRLDAYHRRSLDGLREIFPHDALIPDLIEPGYIELELPSKTKPSVIRDMVALAERTGRVFEPRELVQAVEAREALYPTAIEGGMALLHARHHEDYRFEGSFVVLGRTLQPVGFGAPDGQATTLFFLLCCEDERLHLHTLARLCMMAGKTHLTSQLRNAADAETAYQAMLAAEREVLPAAPDGASADDSAGD